MGAFFQRSGQARRLQTAATPALTVEGELEDWGDDVDLSQKVDRLYEFMPRMSAGIMGKMQLIEERIRALSEDLKRRG
ncbi:hypothetical protein [Alkalilimnicola ehrlichii]|uniref:Uncharacterized protein n=1 Tax=Alkalilimnicola ehrlichii TaxID=351052 RepID=A0A3E0WI42_9GAMM|nr:hypothetical protein [Alkalilimnicola ehrlichii]RFA32119.1 hypothetical protein CAL65_20520 [Alkalilimnicola ehrlichii]